MQRIRVVLDTNLWISFLISKKHDVFDQLFETDQIRLIQEFTAVALRPKFRKYFDADDIEDLLFNFDAYGEQVAVTSDHRLCRDEKDNFLLNLALDGQADYLITGDADLLILNPIEQLKILTYQDFIQIL
jgi:uncharacterized protein